MIRAVAFAVVLLAVAGCARRSSEVRWVGTVGYADGDSAAWSAPGYDDSRWNRARWWDLSRPHGVRWIRAGVTVAPNAAGPLGVEVAALAAHELWWDGVAIGRSGVPAARAGAETPGPVETIDAVPDSLARPGAHVLALRTSAFHLGFSPPNPYWRLLVGPYGSLVLERQRGAWFALVSLSGILLGVLLALATFVMMPRDRAALLLALVGVAAGLLLVAEAWRPLVGYTYDRHIVRLVTIAALTWLVGALLAAFLVVRFPRSHGGRAFLMVALGVAAAGFATPSWDLKLVAMHAVALVFACAWCALAARARRRGALPALLGTVVALVFLFLDQKGFLDRWYYYAVDGLLLCLLLGHLLEWRDEVSASDRARARSASLEAELLKRHLQPHFLMNTLTAIGGWIEEDPATAVRMIGALGDELRVLGRISDRRLVPLAEELRLSRAHLETMSLRRDVAYRLDTDGVEDHALVPPALVHTLVENAVTHGPAAPGEVVMRLAATHERGRTRYVFTSPLEGGAGAAPHEGGTGTRYMVARLREAWGDDWSLEQGAEGGAWRVVLEVPGGSA